MEHQSTTAIRLEIREFYDPTSKSGRAWIVDLLDLKGEVIAEGAGVASDLPSAIKEAGGEIAHLLEEQWSMRGEKL